ncbi:hypothetical protein IGI04_013159 [Brassica rapa subsp. trilocularis]|uniref:Uncharacterized protein n=1 Tax=Brassica rapa subsp. trilocularis TaxID=1813537 RepID=A0ABQ7N814_BRACM|nr:hypothetical protein IGI04_013159 [Brassica rapa subsp. trilocularis]
MFQFLFFASKTKADAKKHLSVLASSLPDIMLRDKEVTRLGLGYASKRGHEMVSLLKRSHES